MGLLIDGLAIYGAVKLSRVAWSNPRAMWASFVQPKPLSPSGKVVMAMLDEGPGAWAHASHTIKHKKSKIELWTSNDWQHVRIFYPNEVNFPMSDRRRLYAAAQRIRAQVEAIWVRSLGGAA